ncbi:hypothetical protein M440DRAFT_1378178 [Trichoderma longibrachiatum ATCC 18648]|uniref:Swiss Army Knife protein DSP-PTPase phosphatase domain-containing protein n=1 Tax=Trichoderma longibrachiatum ATCC 18648 TaxID=983965 RepID=A0A2T4C257_TRILO|nr:hypothetical protein M440DRAFT_1378178 [Trichoderma longibrachiatum ATCC 18648]
MTVIPFRQSIPKSVLSPDPAPSVKVLKQQVSMPLPGLGDDCLEIDQEFFISLYGTDEVFTAEGKSLRVRPYINKRTQLWKCVRDSSNRFAFMNQATRMFLGRDKHENLGCSAPRHGEWESLTFTKLTTGGYELTVPFESRLSHVERAADSGGPYMTVTIIFVQPIGLHKFNAGPFLNFRWVVPGRLARSSAPHYRSSDLDQNMDAEALEYLKDQGITGIISLNTCCLPATAVTRIQEYGMTYDHIPVAESCAPTMDQFRELWDVFRCQTVTLVYSGFGFGRTGTAVCALQLYSHRALSDVGFRMNCVVTPDQLGALNILRSVLQQTLPASEVFRPDEGCQSTNK